MSSWNKCDKLLIERINVKMNMVFSLVIIFIVLILAYYAVCHIIKIWTGCDYNGAVTKLHNFINGKAVYSINNDLGFANDVWDNIKNIIGDKRFEQLLRLSQTAISTPLLSFGFNSGLPYIAVSLYYADDNEKHVIETVIVNLVTQYLKIYGYYHLTLVNWKKRGDLNMPVLQIRYARTREEKNILDIGLQNNRQSIIAVNTNVTDDTDSEDLDE